MKWKRTPRRENMERGGGNRVGCVALVVRCVAFFSLSGVWFLPCGWVVSASIGISRRAEARWDDVFLCHSLFYFLMLPPWRGYWDVDRGWTWQFGYIQFPSTKPQARLYQHLISSSHICMLSPLAPPFTTSLLSQSPLPAVTAESTPVFFYTHLAIGR